MKRFFYMLVIAATAMALYGCQGNPFVNQPDPAYEVATKVGESGVKSRASAAAHNSDNMSASQNYSGIRTSNAEVVKIMTRKDGTFVPITVFRVSTTDGKNGQGIDASYVKNEQGVEIRIGKGSETIEADLGKSLSANVQAQQLDTQETTRHGLDSGPALQDAVDAPALMFEQEKTKRQKAVIDVIPNATGSILGIPGLSN